MTAAAKRILCEFDSLDSDEKLLVRARIVAATQDQQRDAIAHLRGSGNGERLLEKLLKERAEERSRG